MRRASCSLLGHSTALSASDPQSLPPSLYAVCLLASVHDGRASARSQVDDIVSGGEESGDDNFRERLHKELDADRIARYAMPLACSPDCRHSHTCMQHRLQPVELSYLCTRTTQAAGNEQAAP
jgi:hypothetical protein